MFQGTDKTLIIFAVFSSCLVGSDRSFTVQGSDNSPRPACQNPAKKHCLDPKYKGYSSWNAVRVGSGPVAPAAQHGHKNLALPVNAAVPAGPVLPIKKSMPGVPALAGQRVSVLGCHNLGIVYGLVESAVANNTLDQLLADLKTGMHASAFVDQDQSAIKNLIVASKQVLGLEAVSHKSRRIKKNMNEFEKAIRDISDQGACTLCDCMVIVAECLDKNAEEKKQILTTLLHFLFDNGLVACGETLFNNKHEAMPKEFRGYAQRVIRLYNLKWGLAELPDSVERQTAKPLQRGKQARNVSFVGLPPCPAVSEELERVQEVLNSLDLNA